MPLTDQAPPTPKVDESEQILAALQAREAQAGKTAPDLPAKVDEPAPPTGNADTGMHLGETPPSSVEQPKPKEGAAPQPTADANGFTSNIPWDNVSEADRVKLAVSGFKKIQAASDPKKDRPGVDPGLTPDESKAVEYIGNLQTQYAQAQDKAKMEADTPTLLKPFLAGAKGVTKAIGAAGQLAGIHEGTDLSNSIPAVGNQEVVTKLAEGATAFGIGGVAGRIAGVFGAGAGAAVSSPTLVRMANFLQTGGKAAGVGKGAVGADAFMNPYEGNVANILTEVPSLRPVAEMLAVHPDDPTVLAYAKNFVQELGIGAATETVMTLAGAIKIRGGWLKGGTKAAEAEVQAVSKQMKALGEAPAPVKVTKPDAAAQFSKEDVQDIVDKATMVGNGIPAVGKPPEHLFNLETMGTTPEEALRALDGVGEQLRGKMPELTAERSEAMVRQTAQDIGEDPHDLWEMMSKDATHAAQLDSRITLYRAELRKRAEAVSDSAAKVVAGMADEASHAKVTQDLADWAARFKKVSQGQGRALQSFKYAPLSPQEMSAIALAGGDPGKILPLIKPKGVVRRLFDAGISLWQNSILSGVRTSEANTITNHMMSYLRPLERIAGGSLTGSTEATMHGAGMLVGLHTFFKDAMEMAKMSWDHETPFLDRTSKVEGNVADLSSGGIGIPDNTLGKGMDYLFTAARTPTRTLTATDELYKQLNFRASMNAHLYMEGMRRGIAPGPELVKFVNDTFQLGFDESGRALTSQNYQALQKVYKIVGEELGNKLAEIGDASLKDAQQATFTSPLDRNTLGGAVGGMGLELNAAIPVARLVNPFVKTPTNILREFGMRLPAGLNFISKQMRSDFAAGGIRRADAVGKTATAQMIWGGAALAASQGVITGGGPSNPEARSRLMETGWRPYSVKVDGKYVPYDRKEPFSWVFGIAADFSEVTHAMQDGNRDEMGAAMIYALQKNIASTSFLKGISNGLNLLMNSVQTNSDGEVSGVTGWDKFKQSYANSLVPAILEDGAAIQGEDDPTIREVRSMMDAFKEGTPWFSSTLEAKRNVFGEPIINTRNEPFGVFKSTNWGSETGDPAMAELVQLGGSVGAVPERLEGGLIDLTAFKNDKGQTAFDRLGQMRQEGGMRKRFEQMVTDKSFKALPPYHPKLATDRAEVIQRFFRDEQKRNMERLKDPKGGFPDLAKAYQKLAEAKARARGGQTTQTNGLLEVIQQFQNPK